MVSRDCHGAAASADRLQNCAQPFLQVITLQMHCIDRCSAPCGASDHHQALLRRGKSTDTLLTLPWLLFRHTAHQQVGG